MDEYADIYYVDSRNAVVRDHRPGNRPGGFPGWINRPTATVHHVPPAATRPIYQPAQPQVIYQPAPPPVMYAPPYGSQSTAAALLGKLTTGQIVEMVAQVFGALMTLPNAPVATRDIETDVGNLILYQGALASHAKRDEQVRTLGSLVAKLVG